MNNGEEKKIEEIKEIIGEYLRGLEGLRKKRNQGIKKIFDDLDNRKKEEIRKKLKTIKTNEGDL
jgi:hypothetical protein